MRYMLLIHSDETLYPDMSPEQMGKLMGEYEQFDKDLDAAGVHKGSDRLRPSDTATTVRCRNEDVLTTDGPFAETKEQFGGYYIIDVENLDDAIHWAAKVPTAKYGSIEVRPIWNMEDS